MIPQPLSSGTKGVALVLTLSLIVLLTALVVGFTLTARFDRALSAGYAKADRAELAALSALNHAKALLASNIPDVGPNAPDVPANWWVAPGRLWTQTDNAPPLAVNLYSGDSTSPSDPDLNRRKIDGTYPIEPGGTAMRVAWIPVGKDPAQEISSTNPIVSRFAYWIDAENTRINLRTARVNTGMRTELAPTATSYIASVPGTAFKPVGPSFGGVAPGSTICVDLSGLAGTNKINATTLSGMQISNVREYRENFPNDTDWRAFYNANQFDLSIWGESPEFNPLGKNRLTTVQNRNKSLPGFQFYWDLEDPSQLPADPMLLQGGNYPPGTGPVVNEYAYYLYSARALANAFLSTEWPGYAGSSLAAKWAARAGLAPADSNRLAEQVAWNFLTSHAFMFRGNRITSELSGLGSSGRVGAGTSGEPVATSDLFPSALATTTGGRFVGQSNNPYVTELGLELAVEPSGAASQLRIKMVGELFLPQYVVAYNSSTNVEDGIVVGPSTAGGKDGAALIPLSVSFSIPAAATTVTAGDVAFATKYPGWNTKASGTDIVFTLKVTNPLSNWITGAGRLSAELLDASKNPIGSNARIKSNQALALRSPQIAGTRDTSLIVPLLGSPAAVSLGDVQLKVIAVKNVESNEYRIFQYCPLQDNSLASSLLVPSPQSPFISLGSMTISSTLPPQVFTVEVSDPRRCALSDAWLPSTGAGVSFSGTNSLALANNWPSPLPEIRAFCLTQADAAIPSTTGYYSGTPGEQGTVYSPGQFSTLWTAPPYLVPTTGNLALNLTSTDTGIPDHLALELINVETGLALGSNYGTINPNTRIYPTSWGLAARTKALEALFRRWQVGGTPVDASALAASIVTAMPSDGYRYRGEIIPSLQTAGGAANAGATQWQKQALFRSLAGRLSVQSGSFGVWGVAQTVQQTPGGNIVVTGEKRFYSVVRRRPYTGIDGVYGNGKSDASGNFTETIAGTGGFKGPAFGQMRDTFDGPDAVPVPVPASVPVPDETSSTQTLRAAYNPLKSYMTNETAYFEYLEP